MLDERMYSAAAGESEETVKRMEMANETAKINEAESSDSVQKYMDEVIAAGLTNEDLDRLEAEIHKLRSSRPLDN